MAYSMACVGWLIASILIYAVLARRGRPAERDLAALMAAGLGIVGAGFLIASRQAAPSASTVGDVFYLVNKGHGLINYGIVYLLVCLFLFVVGSPARPWAKRLRGLGFWLVQIGTGAVVLAPHFPPAMARDYLTNDSAFRWYVNATTYGGILLSLGILLLVVFAVLSAVGHVISKWTKQDRAETGRG